MFIVRYANMRYAATRTNVNLIASFDIIFYENPSRQGDIEIRYYSLASSGSTSIVVGLQSYDDASAYYSLFGNNYQNHNAAATLLVGKQMTFRYIGEDSENTACGAFGYNFASYRGADISFLNEGTGDTYYYNPCGEVNNAACANSAAAEKAMICKVTSGNVPSDLGVFGPGAIKYELPLGGSPGLNMIAQTGSYCAAINASVFTSIQWMCAPGMNPPRMVAALEITPCVYFITVISEAACSGAVRTNETIYRHSILPECNSVTGNGYSASLCPRATSELQPRLLTAPTQILIQQQNAVQAVDLPFAFNMYGQSYQRVNISVKGTLWFGQNPSLEKPLAFPAITSTPEPAIVAFGGSFTTVVLPGLNSPNISYSVEVGAGGVRQFIVRYWDMKYTSSSGLIDLVTSFDVILTEGAVGNVEVRYYVVSPTSIETVTIGVRGPRDAAAFTAVFNNAPMTSQLAFQLRGATLSFTASAPCTTYDDVYEQYSGSLCALQSTAPLTLTNPTTPTFGGDNDGVNSPQIMLPFPIQVYGIKSVSH